MRLTGENYRFDTWDVFLADRSTALAASEAIISGVLSEGVIELDGPTNAESAHTGPIQALMGAVGIVPVSGLRLTGTIGSGTTIVIGDQDGVVVATAHGYLPHNSHSPYRRYAWAGFAAVDAAQRGKGLVHYVYAWIAVSVFRDLDATCITNSLPPRTFHSAKWSPPAGFILNRPWCAGLSREPRTRASLDDCIPLQDPRGFGAGRLRPMQFELTFAVWASPLAWLELWRYVASAFYRWQAQTGKEHHDR